MGFAGAPAYRTFFVAFPKFEIGKPIGEFIEPLNLASRLTIRHPIGRLPSRVLLTCRLFRAWTSMMDINNPKTGLRLL